MAVKLKGNLPKTDRNGLAPIETELVANRLTGEATVAVVVLGTTGIHSTVEDDWRNQPLLSILHIEPMVDEASREAALGLLGRAAGVRIGKVTLDFGDGVNLGDLPAAVEAKVSTWFQLHVKKPGKGEAPIVHVELMSSTAGLISERFVPIQTLPTELAELAQGEGIHCSFEQLPAALIEIGEAMLRDRGHEADVVDGEVVA